MAGARHTNTGRTKDQRLSREDWLKGALSVLAESGVERVKVEPLAKRLGVTKGSFYWHFKDRRDLLDALLTWWESEAGPDLLNRVESGGGDASDRLWRLIEMLCLRNSDAHDVAIRAWAYQDGGAAEAVRRVDRLRIGYLEKLFKELGFERDDAMARARFVHYYQVGEDAVGLDDSFGTKLSLAVQRHKLLTA